MIYPDTYHSWECMCLNIAHHPETPYLSLIPVDFFSILIIQEDSYSSVTYVVIINVSLNDDVMSNQTHILLYITKVSAT